MIKSRKVQLAALSLTVAAGLAVIPAVHGLAAEKETSERAGPAACQALGTDLLDMVTGLQSSLLAVPPDLSKVTEPVNGLLDTVLGLIDLGCLPELALPLLADVPGELPVPDPGLPDPGLPIPGLPGQGEELPLPLPTLPVDPPVDPGLPDLPIGDLLPAVPECTDLTADLLDAVTGVLAALLSSSGLPDLTGALDAVTELLDTITGLLSPDAACLPAPEVPVADG